MGRAARLKTGLQSERKAEELTLRAGELTWQLPSKTARAL